MKTYEEMIAAEIRTLRWKMFGYIAKVAVDLAMTVTMLYLLIEWYGNLGPCRP